MLSSYLSVPVRRALAVTAAAGMIGMSMPAQAQVAPAPHGPTSVADLAEGLLGAVVNISTSQNVGGSGPKVAPPQLPEGAPFEDLFDDFFNQREGETRPARAVSIRWDRAS